MSRATRVMQATRGGGILLLALLLTSVLQNSFAAPSPQQTPSQSSQLQQAPQTRGQDPHLGASKSDGQNPWGEGVMLPSGFQPPHKSRDGERGAIASAWIDNFTGLYVKLYLDGEYHATLPPYAEMRFYLPVGPHQLYARVDYSDGHYGFWEPQNFEFKAGESQTWQLKD